MLSAWMLRASFVSGTVVCGAASRDAPGREPSNRSRYSSRILAPLGLAAVRGLFLFLPWQQTLRARAQRVELAEQPDFSFVSCFVLQGMYDDFPRAAIGLIDSRRVEFGSAQ